MAERRLQYGYNEATGDWERCRAKPGNEGKYGCPHAEHQHMTRSESVSRNEAHAEEVARGELEGDAGALVKNDGNTTGDATGDAPHSDGERIESLLTAVVPMRDERKGKLPKFNPDEIAAKNNNRLARYLMNNFDGDRDTVEAEALRTLYAGDDVERFDPDGDIAEQVQAIRDRYGDSLTHSQEQFLNQLERKPPFSSIHRYALGKGTADDNTTENMYVDMDGCRVIMVTDGKLSKASAAVNTRFTYYPSGGGFGEHTNVDFVHFGRVLAARGIVNSYDGFDELATEVQKYIGTQLLGDGDYSNGKSGALDENGANEGAFARELSHNFAVANAERLIDKGKDELSMRDPDYPLPPRARIIAVGKSENLKQTYDELKRDYPEFMRSLPGSYQSNISNYVAKDTMLNMNGKENYQRAMRTMLNSEENGVANYQYAKHNNSGSTARVWDWKKNRDEAHDEAGRRSTFAHDFTSVEIDDSVNLDTFNRLGNEWAGYRDTLPKTHHQPSLKIRFTGRHNATGLYQPATRILAVDPRHPDSFTHEYFHHWDWDTGGDGSQSMRAEFAPIVNHYKENVNREAIGGTNPERYLAPTEVLARAGELYMHWKREEQGAATSNGQSLIKTDDAYATRFDYQPLLGMKGQIISFFDNHFHDGD